MPRSKCKVTRNPRRQSSRKCRSKKRSSRARSKARSAAKLNKAKSCAPLNSANERRNLRRQSCTQSIGRSKSAVSNNSLGKRKSKSTVRNLGTKPKSETGSDSDSESESELDSSPPKSETLPGPLISPRDPHHYRLIKLKNGLKAILVSTCGLGIEDAKDTIKEAAVTAASACSSRTPATSVFNRRRGKRDRGADKDDDATGKGKHGRGFRNYDEKNENNPGCVDGGVDKFDEKVKKKSVSEAPPQGRWREGSIMDAMMGFEPAEKRESDENSDEKTDDEDADDDSWLTNQEPKDKKLLAQACQRVKGNGLYDFDAEIALTIGCGSINDPPNLRGLAYLTLKAVVNGIMRSKNNSSSWQIPQVLTTTSLLTYLYYVKDLNKSLTLLADKLLNVEVDKDDVLGIVDSLEQMIEFNQCLYCWNYPITDPRIQAIILSFSKDDSPLKLMTHSGYPPDLWAAASKADLENEIQDYMHLNYIGNNMTLAVQAPLPLNELDEMVTKAFDRIPAGDRVENSGVQEPFDNEKFQKFYDVSCNNLNCNNTGDEFVLISWALSPDLWKDKTSKPIDYIFSLVNSVSPDGLKSHLKSLHWISSLMMTYAYEGFHQNQFCTILQIQLTLTRTGLRNLNEVIEAVFAYIKFLKDTGPKKYVYREMQKMASINFHALPHELSLESRATYGIEPESLSAWLQYSDAENMILEQFLYTKYDATEIRKILDLLVPETANFMLISCDHVQKEDIDLIEPIYQTRYAVREVAPEVMQKWSSPEIAFAFQMPAPNPYLPDDFCLQKGPVSQNKEPVLYQSETESNARIWYQYDKAFHHFRIYYIHFLSPESFEGPESALMLRIWGMILREILDPILYPAEVAGILYSIETSQYGLMVTLYSWNHKIEDVLKLIIDEIINCGTNVVPELFEKKKKLLSGHLLYMAKNPRETEDIYDAVTILDHWPVSTLYNELKSLDMNDFLEFTFSFGDNGTFVAFLKGNVFEKTARDLEALLMTRLWSTFGTASLQSFPVRMNEIPLGERVIKTLRLASYLPYLNDVTNFYQLGPLCIEDRAVAEIVLMILEESTEKWADMEREKWAKKKARTRNHRGEQSIDEEDDEVWTLVEPNLLSQQGVLTMAITCYGPEKSYSCDCLEEKINDFLTKFDLCPWETSKKRFKELKDDAKHKLQLYSGYRNSSSSNVRIERFPSRSNEQGTFSNIHSDDSYSVIKNLSLRFNEISCLTQAMDSVTPTDVRNFFDDYLTYDGVGYRMLSVQLVAQKTPNSKPGSDAPPPPKITVEEWRRRRTKIRDCIPQDDRLYGTMNAYDENEQLTLKFLGDQDGKCDSVFVTDLDTFRQGLYQFPDEMC